MHLLNRKVSSSSILLMLGSSAPYKHRLPVLSGPAEISLADSLQFVPHTSGNNRASSLQQEERDDQSGSPVTRSIAAILLLCISSTIAECGSAGYELTISVCARPVNGELTDDTVGVFTSSLEAFFEELLEMSKSR